MIYYKEGYLTKYASIKDNPISNFVLNDSVNYLKIEFIISYRR